MPDPRLAAVSPPPGFHEVESHLEGVRVFAPVPETEVRGGTETFQCPQCAATLGFDPRQGQTACAFCGYLAGEVAAVGRAATAHEFTLEALRAGAQGWGVDRQVTHCETCASEVAWEPGRMSATCAFCGGNKVHVIDASAPALRPQTVVPFKVEAAALRQLASTWLGRGWLHPPDLQRLARVDAIQGIYLPYWVFDATVDARWKAEVGRQVTEWYTDSQGNRRSRTKIVWEWKSGRVVLPVEELLVPGTSHVSRKLLERLLPFDLDSLVAYAPGLLAGFSSQTYDVALPEAWEEGKAEIRERGKKACYADTGSSHVRSFSMSADLDDEQWRYTLLPVYVSAYRFDGKTWVFLVNGQTGEVVGQKPVLWWKVWAAMAAMWALPVLCFLAGLPALLLAGAGVVLLVAALVLAIAAGAGSFALYRHAVDLEAA